MCYWWRVLWTWIWYVMLCSPVIVHQYCGETYSIHLQSWTVSHTNNQQEAGSKHNEREKSKPHYWSWSAVRLSGLVFRPISGSWPDFSFFQNSFPFVIVWHSFWQEDRSRFWRKPKLALCVDNVCNFIHTHSLPFVKESQPLLNTYVYHIIGIHTQYLQLLSP